MERHKILKYFVNTCVIVAIIGLGNACQSNATPAIGNNIAPLNLSSATATAFYYDCIFRSNPDNFDICTSPASVELAQLDELRAVINSQAIDPLYRPMLLQTLEAPSQIPSENIRYHAWKIEDPSIGFTYVGCTKDIPFMADLILPRTDLNKDNGDPSLTLGTDWHEREHLRRAVLRYKKGDTCPFNSPIIEEMELDYWGNYVVYAARKTKYPNSPRHDVDMRDYGFDIYEAVGKVFIPQEIGPDSELYQLVYGPLKTRAFWLNKRKFDELPSDIQTDVLKANSDWNSYLGGASQKDKKAIQEMINIGVGSERFFSSNLP